MITGKAKLAGIIGWPVAHSLSPVLHGYWLAEHGIDGAMIPLPARVEDFAAVVDGARRAGFRGMNVTVPHKEAAFALAHHVHHSAQEAGAANLLIFREDGIEARNTDTYGLAASLRERVALGGKTAVLLGAGGAARGTALAIHQLGAAHIHILNRNAARAEALAKSLPIDPAKLSTGSLAGWDGAARDAALVVNATSAGMGRNPPLSLDLSVLPPAAAVCDIVYNPLETPLLKAAAAQGLATIDGLGMLMHQAVPSFAAFFGVESQVTPGLRAALVEALRDRA